MSKKTTLIALGLIGMVILLGIISTWNFRRIGKSLLGKENLPKFETLETPQLQEIIRNLKEGAPSKTNYKVYITPDEQLKVKYPLNWIEVKDEEILEKIIPKEEAEKYGFEILFLAQKFQGGKYAQLKIYKSIQEEKGSINDIIERMRKINQEEGWGMKILSSDIKEKDGIFEALYQREGRLSIHSKERIILLETETKSKAYFIIFLAYDKDWGEVKEEANFIIDSVQLIK